MCIYLCWIEFFFFGFAISKFPQKSVAFLSHLSHVFDVYEALNNLPNEHE